MTHTETKRVTRSPRSVQTEYEVVVFSITSNIGLFHYVTGLYKTDYHSLSISATLSIYRIYGQPFLWILCNQMTWVTPLLVIWFELKILSYTCYLAIWLSGYLVIWLPGYLAIWLSGYLVTWLFGYLVIWFIGSLVIWLSGYLVIWLSDHLVIWLSGYLVIWLFGYLVIWLFGFLVIWLAGRWGFVWI